MVRLIWKRTRGDKDWNIKRELPELSLAKILLGRAKTVVDMNDDCLVIGINGLYVQGTFLLDIGVFSSSNDEENAIHVLAKCKVLIHKETVCETQPRIGLHTVLDIPIEISTEDWTDQEFLSGTLTEHIGGQVLGHNRFLWVGK